jgi:hypothetical protein
MPRFHRQHEEILATVRAGDLRRALPLAREHLTEFPEDTIVRRSIIDSVESNDDPSLLEELRGVVPGIPS